MYNTQMLKFGVVFAWQWCRAILRLEVRVRRQACMAG